MNQIVKWNIILRIYFPLNILRNKLARKYLNKPGYTIITELIFYSLIFESKLGRFFY